MSASAFSIDCECGAQIGVSASQAGASIECRCGRMLKIPLLSELRKRQGKGAYEAGAIDTIQRLMKEGRLPSSDACVISGRPTKDLCRFHVQCERFWLKGQNRYIQSIFLALMQGLLTRNAPDPDAVVQGRERGVDVVLRVDEEFHRQVRRYSQGALKNLLRNEPAYAALLDEYPNATIM